MRILHNFFFNGIQYLNMFDGKRYDYEFREDQVFNHGGTLLSFFSFRCFKAVRRLLMFMRFRSLLLELRVFLSDHTCFFYSNMVFHYLFPFKKSLIRKSV